MKKVFLVVLALLISCKVGNPNDTEAGRKDSLRKPPKMYPQ